ncbi:hypothetical protein [uncultured Mediterranean phage uvMED]|nr:hypothetical protein [uncultured Mediterranean phage uvMED]
MAITKELLVEKIEVVGTWNVQVATDTVIKEDNTEIGRSRHRHVLQPYTSSKDSDDKWTHTDTDISAEATEVQAVANAVWTDTVKANYKTYVESQEV